MRDVEGVGDRLTLSLPLALEQRMRPEHFGEHALDLALALREVRNDHADPLCRIAVEQFAAPLGASPVLVGGIRAFQARGALCDQLAAALCMHRYSRAR